MDQEDRHRQQAEQIADEFGEMICQDRAESTYDFLRDFTMQYVGMSAIMRRRMTYQHKPKAIEGWRYHSIEEVLMFNTTPVEGDPMATPMDPMIKGNCFANAFRTSLLRPEMRYTEGWATMERSYPTHHAWLTGPDGSIHDPTWKTIGDENKVDRLRTCYLGVAVPREQHLGWFLETGSANILYNGEMMLEGVLRDGPAHFEQFAVEEIDEELVADTIAALDAHGLWTREPGSHIFVHSRTGQQWDGRKNCFV